MALINWQKKCLNHHNTTIEEHNCLSPYYYALKMHLWASGWLNEFYLFRWTWWRERRHLKTILFDWIVTEKKTRLWEDYSSCRLIKRASEYDTHWHRIYDYRRLKIKKERAPLPSENRVVLLVSWSSLDSCSIAAFCDLVRWCYRSEAQN